MWRVKEEKDEETKKVKTVSATGTVNVGVSSATINVGTNGVGGIVNIGNGSTGTVVLRGTTTFGFLNISDPAGGANLGSNLTSGDFNLVNGASLSGNIAFASGSSNRTGTINIGTAGSGAITIGNASAALKLNGSTLSVAESTSTTTINGTVNLAQNGAANLNVGNNVVGTATILSPSVNINSASGGSVNIGHTASSLTLRASSMDLDSRSSLSIGDNMAGGDINIVAGGSFTGNVYIASGNNSRTGTVNIGTAGGGAITLGNIAAPLTLRGSTTTLSSPLTLGNAPTLASELGGQSVILFNAGNLAPGAWTNSNSTTLPAGRYFVIINPNFQPGNATTVTFSNIDYRISTAINGGGTAYFSLNDTNLKISEINGSPGTYSTLYQIGIIVLATSQTLYASVQINYTTTGVNGVIVTGTPGAVYYYRFA